MLFKKLSSGPTIILTIISKNTKIFEGELLHPTFRSDIRTNVAQIASQAEIALQLFKIGIVSL